MEIQIRAGIYVTDALVECCGSVREKRLRNAPVKSALFSLQHSLFHIFDLFPDIPQKFQGLA